MPNLRKPSLIALGTLPPELTRALEEEFDLIAYALLPDGAAPEFKIAVTTSMAGADAAVMRRLHNLELIACNGAGLERIDVEEAKRCGILIVNTPDAVTIDTADFAIALMFALGRRLVEADRFVRSGRWQVERMAPSQRISGRVVGVVGLGRIGSAIAARAAGLGMPVLYTKRSPDNQAPYEFVVDIGDMAERCDVLILACSGGAETHGLVNADVLRRLGPKGVLINVSRGSVVDEEALIAALSASAIAGAALDVFAAEPQFDGRLLAFENVILSPHYAAVTAQTRHDMARTLLNAITAHAASGHKPI